MLLLRLVGGRDESGDDVEVEAIRGIRKGS